MEALVLYDQDCGFCRWSADVVARLVRGVVVVPVAIQSAQGAELLHEVPSDAHLRSSHVVVDGRLYSEGAGPAILATFVPGLGALGRFALRHPRLANRAYYALADRRELWGRLLRRARARRG